MRYRNTHFDTAPFFRLLLSYLLGIGLGFYINPNSHVYLWLIVTAVLCISLFFITAVFLKFKNFRSYRYFSILFYLFLVFSGWCFVWKTHPDILTTHFSRHSPQALIGYIDDEPKITKKTV